MEIKIQKQENEPENPVIVFSHRQMMHLVHQKLIGYQPLQE